jgi:hypothetical protein
MPSQYSFKTEAPRKHAKGFSCVNSLHSCSRPFAFMMNGQPNISETCRLAQDSLPQHDGYTPSMKGRLCPSLSSTGLCAGGSSCSYSHTVQEARSFNPNFKTKICEFAANGFCSKANQCRYAHSFSELDNPRISRRNITSFDCFPSVGRNLSSVSTADLSADSVEESTHNLSCGSDGEMSPIVSCNLKSPTTRVCYVAPTEQRSVIPKRQRRRSKVSVPPSYHYVEQLQRLRAPTAYPFVQISDAVYGNPAPVFPYGISGHYFGNQMMYSVMSPDVIYED